MTKFEHYYTRFLKVNLGLYSALVVIYLTTVEKDKVISIKTISFMMNPVLYLAESVLNEYFSGTRYSKLLILPHFWLVFFNVQIAVYSALEGLMIQFGIIMVLLISEVALSTLLIVKVTSVKKIVS